MKPNYRRCISCRRVGPKTEFWRIVRCPRDHAIVLDEGMGRSAYLCPCQGCLQVAQKKNRLSRALKTTVPPETYSRLRQRLDTVAPPSVLLNGA